MWPSPNVPAKISSEYENAGKKLAAKAYQWCEQHPNEFERIYSYVKSLQGTFVKGHLRDRVAIYCLDNGIKVGKPAFGHDYWAGISRYLAIKDPTLIGDPIVFHESAIDHVGLYEWEWLDD